MKSFKFLSAHFPKTTIRALDRGYDAWYVFDYFMAEKENFIVRMKDRKLLHNGKEVLLKTLASKFKGKYALKFKGKNGKKANCKISIVPVSLPKYPDVNGTLSEKIKDSIEVIEIIEAAKRLHDISKCKFTFYLLHCRWLSPSLQFPLVRHRLFLSNPQTFYSILFR